MVKSKLLFLQNPLFLVVKSTLPNHRVNSAWLSSPCCQVSIPKLPIPHHQINIAKLSSPNSLCELPDMSFELPISLKKFGLSNALIFSGLLKLLPKKIKPPWSPPPPPTQDFSLPFLFFSFDLIALWSLRGALSKFKLPSKLNFNILRANWKVLSSQFIFSFHPFLWMMWIWSHLNGTKVHPWKFMKDEIPSKNITYDFISSIKYSSFIIFLFVWKVNSFSWCIW